jgi:hypothetical protein
MRTTAEPSPGRRPPPLHRILHGYRRRASGPGQVAVPPGFLHRRFITSHGTPPWKPSPPPRRSTEGAPPPPPWPRLWPGQWPGQVRS